MRQASQTEKSQTNILPAPIAGQPAGARTPFNRRDHFNLAMFPLVVETSLVVHPPFLFSLSLAYLRKGRVHRLGSAPESNPRPGGDPDMPLFYNCVPHGEADSLPAAVIAGSDNQSPHVRPVTLVTVPQANGTSFFASGTDREPESERPTRTPAVPTGRPACTTATRAACPADAPVSRCTSQNQNSFCGWAANNAGREPVLADRGTAAAPRF